MMIRVQVMIQHPHGELLITETQEFPSQGSQDAIDRAIEASTKRACLRAQRAADPRGEK